LPGRQKKKFLSLEDRFLGRKPIFNKREGSISVLTKKILFIFFIILVIFCGYTLAETPIILSLLDTKISEKPIRAEFVLKIGSDKTNEDFYKPPAFAVGKDDQIYILDSGNSRIQCFSKEGKFLFSFGRRGQGPGELSNDARLIKILSDGNIYVIDNLQRRINVYNQEGKFLYLAKTSARYNDIVLLNGTYYLSNMILKENHKPIHISRSLGKIDADFGIFVEPAVGILKQISQVPMPEPWRYYYSNGNYTKLIVTNKSELIFSQAYPYRLIKYDAKGNVLKDIMGDVDFDTYHHVKFSIDEFSVGIITSPPGGAKIVLDVSIKNDNQVVVAYCNPEKSIIYIDLYDLDLNLISRYKLLNIIADISKGNYVRQLIIDNDNNLYGMVISEENYPQLVKYKLIFD
jgi:hypothetical protein